MKKNHPKRVVILGSPNQIRTGVLALKGRCPGPLDDGAKTAVHFSKMRANYNWLLPHCQDLLITERLAQAQGT